MALATRTATLFLVVCSSTSHVPRTSAEVVAKVSTSLRGGMTMVSSRQTCTGSAGSVDLLHVTFWS